MAYLTQPQLAFMFAVFNISMHFGTTQSTYSLGQFDYGCVGCIPESKVCNGKSDCCIPEKILQMQLKHVDLRSIGPSSQKYCQILFLPDFPIVIITEGGGGSTSKGWTHI